MSRTRENSKEGPFDGAQWVLTVDELGPDPLLAALREHHTLADVKEGA